MRRFTKVASLLAAMSVLACSAAFAVQIPLHPGNLVGKTDSRVLLTVSNDVSAQGMKSYDTIVSPDYSFDGADFRSFGAGIIGTNIVLQSGNKNVYLSPDKYASPDTGVSFDKLLVRTTDKTFSMTFDAKNNSATSLLFGLRSGFEKESKRASFNLLAKDCTLECDYFFHSANHTSPIAPGEKDTLTDTVTWTGTGNNEFYVECCDHLGFVAATGVDAVASALSTSKDMVVAHLSTTPFLRVRVASADQVLTSASKYVSAKAGQKDFRASAWKHSNLQTSAVDVPEGQTFNMGVLYTDYSNCDVCGQPDCNNGYLPVVAVTNLGDKSVYIGSNYETEIASWLCNSWCGLCEFDDMMSGDKGSLYDGAYNKLPETIKAQSGLSDCVCHIYPAFTNTFKGKGNVDIAYKAHKTEDLSSVATTIAGRVNTSWNRQSFNTSSLCTSCNEEAAVYYPCDCLSTYYARALGVDSIRFAASSDLTVVKYTNDITKDTAKTATDYALLDISFKVKDTVSRDIMLTKMSWTVKAADLNAAGLVGGANWWRADIWNKLAIKLNGKKLDTTNVKNMTANDMTASELAFLTIVNGPQRDLTTTSEITVDLFVFVMDSDEDDVKYYKAPTTNNRFLVVYDGKKDGIFDLKGYISKGDSVTPEPEVFGVTAGKSELNVAVDADKATDITAKNVAAGAEVIWSVSSSDIVSLDKTVGLTVKATGLKAGSAVVTAKVSGDEAQSADVTIIVKNEAPAPSGDSGGGCNVGFAPALLLLLAPLAFLKK
ncbi:MAG: SYNERG-CTERM sorting domain-containing protein [Dethiosulfovibrio sp.]|nr:SYNERG-CTERM sorting domain-containing protein [Dethiosulfovibrio sp.]